MERPRPNSLTAGLAALLWTAGVCTLLLLPGGAFTTPDGGIFEHLPPGSDKVVHALFFAGEVFFLERFLRSLSGFRRPLLAAIVTTASLAALTEIAQSFSPGRTPELADLAANLAGIGSCAAGLALSGRTGAPALGALESSD